MIALLTVVRLLSSKANNDYSCASVMLCKVFGLVLLLKQMMT